MIDEIVQTQECGDCDPDFDIEEQDIAKVTVDYGYWEYADDEEV